MLPIVMFIMSFMIPVTIPTSPVVWFFFRDSSSSAPTAAAAEASSTGPVDTQSNAPYAVFLGNEEEINHTKG
jgi:hypothetical protein